MCLIACGLIPELQKIQVRRTSFRGAHVIRVPQSKNIHSLSEERGRLSLLLGTNGHTLASPKADDDPCSIHSVFTYLFQFPLQRIYTSCDSNSVCVCVCVCVLCVSMSEHMHVNIHV